MDPTVLVTFVFTAVIGIGSSIAGAGSGLLITPYLLLIGLPAHSAVSTPKLAGLGISLGSITRFNKDHDIDWYCVRKLLPLAILAGLLGPQILFRVDAELVKTVVLIALIMLAPVMLISKAGLSERIRGRGHRYAGYGAYFSISSMQAAFGSGIGSLLMYVMMGPLGMTAIKANASKRVIGLALLIPSFIQFALAGYIDWSQGIAMFAGMSVGGWIGANIAIKKGNAFVRIAFAIGAALGAVSILLT